MKKILKIAGVVLLASMFFSCGDKRGMVKITGGALTAEQIEALELHYTVAEVVEPVDGEQPAEPVEPKMVNTDEMPANFSIKVSDFFMSKYEVTQELWYEVMKSDADANNSPAYFGEKPADKEKQELRPVERISWYDCLYFCNKLSKQDGLEPVYTLENIERYSKDSAIKKATVTADFTKNGYRLPTRAEWYFAACGGTKAKQFNVYSGGEDLDKNAWFHGNSGEKTHQVGLKKPNELGLYDMTGNVAEWCWDYQWTDKFEDKEYVDYTGPEKGRYRFMIGGAFVKDLEGAVFNLDNAGRWGGIQGLRYWTTGFRLVKNAPKK